MLIGGGVFNNYRFTVFELNLSAFGVCPRDNQIIFICSQQGTTLIPQLYRSP